MVEEIEKKFLVSDSPTDLGDYPHNEILQGYIVSTGEVEVRLRKKHRRCLQTVKTGSGLVREEVEIELTESQFQQLWPLTAGKRLRKTRYEIPHESLVIELDVYADKLAGLLVAEVEFVSVAASVTFSPPAWFDREVTGDLRFKNASLATMGLPP